MGWAVCIRLSGNHRPIPRAAVVALLLLLLLLILVPPVATSPSDTPVKKPDTALLRRTTPAPVTTLPPAAEPARANRTTLVKDLRAIERPQVTVPAGVFIIVITIAGIGIIATVYLLLRRWAAATAGGGAGKTPAAGNPTLAGDIIPTDPGATAPRTDPAVPFPPSLEKRFSRPEFIGEGGLARVFRATSRKTGMIVAVKVPIRFDEVTGTHFARDIALWQGLDHENIIRIRSSNILPVPYIEMDYAPSSLAAVPLPLPEERAIAMVLGAARGIASAHEKGIVHRDIKPENILLSSDGVPKVTDWGLGRAMSDTCQSSVIGFSPAYAAPEQLAPHRYGRPGPATDIYQLGMLLCELLTGAPAFRGSGLHELNTAILEKPPDIPPWNGRQEHRLKTIILRCLEKRPEDRYGSVAALIHDLEGIRSSAG